jgi:hypothetical protein
VHREAAFAFALGDGPMLTGFVDVIAHEADGAALIVDDKSDRVGDADLEELVEAGYGVQRRIYALRAARARPPSGRPPLPSARPGPCRTFRSSGLRDADASAARRSGTAAGGRLSSRRGPAPRGCATCPGRGGLAPTRRS